MMIQSNGFSEYDSDLESRKTVIHKISVFVIELLKKMP